MIFQDSLGIAHHIREPLLKAGIPAFAAPPPPCAGAFRALVDDVIELRRRRVAEKVRAVPTNSRDPKAEKEAESIAAADHLPTVRQRPGRPGAKPLTKSLAAMTAELDEMVNATRAQTAEVQRRTAIQMFADMNERARAGRLDSLSAAKLDALQHRHARALGLETTGVRA
ncbi:MAG: hypothetical protein E6R10_07190 [Rhodocyclaceae bacterium]|nr:MAG: hypothetical protein E6R10_07190 [Rhodocyclaceae bacterium]